MSCDNEPSGPSNPQEERARLKTLQGFDVLDTEREEQFDRITTLCSTVLKAPICLISLIDAERQWFKSNVGLVDCDETPRDVAFCSHAIKQDSILEIEDAQTHPLTCDNPLVTGEPGIRFYAGKPLIARNGHRLGTLCVIALEPRQPLTDQEREILTQFAAMVMHELEVGRAMRSALGLAERYAKAI